MIIKNITKEATTYFNMEQKTLEENQFFCNCDQPGYKTECLECNCYLDIIKQVQAKLYKNPELDCIIPSNEKYEVKEYNEGYHLKYKQQCILLYKEIGNASKVARKLKIGDFVVYKWLHEEGLIKSTKTFYSTEVKRNAVEVYYQVNSYVKASEITGIHHSNIRNWVINLEEKEHLELNKLVSPETKQDIVDSYQSLKSTREVAKKLGVNRKTVQKYLKKEGIL